MLKNDVTDHRINQFKGGPSDLGTKNLQKYEKFILILQSLLFFTHKTPVVIQHRVKLEIYYGPGRHRRSIFTSASRSFTH